MNKKILITTILILIVVPAVFILFKVYSYNHLKSNCVEESIEDIGYMINVYFAPNTTSVKIENFISMIEKNSSIESIKIRNKEDELKKIIEDSVDSIVKQNADMLISNNPTSSSIVINLNTSSPEFLSSLKKDIFSKAESKELKIIEYDDSRARLLNERVNEIQETASAKDFFKFIVNNKDSNFAVCQ